MRKIFNQSIKQMENRKSKWFFPGKLAMLVLMFVLGVGAYAQTKSVKGTVVDDMGEPIIGANVLISGTTQGTVTDLDGNYTLNNVPEDAVLRASFIGYENQELAVAGRSVVDFTLKSESTELDDVVVVGYGTMKKTDLTGSVASVSTEKLNAKGATSVMENLQGSVPGVSITQSSGRTNGGFNIEIRGRSSINSDTKPIYVIDGVVCSDMDFLNPQDIERLDVLKDASSTAIYGSRATAGVIMITTKSGSAINKDKDDKCKQKFNITYDGYYGLTNVVREANLMSPEEFYNYRFLRFLMPSSTGPQPTYVMTSSSYKQMACFTGDGAEDESVLKKQIRNGSTTDWVDLVTKTGKKQNHYIALNGSTSDLSYHFGVGVTDDEGIYAGDKMRRFNFKGSVDSDANKFLSAGFSLNTAVTKNKYANDSGISIAYRMNPFMVPYNADGELNEKPGNYVSLGSSSSYQFSDQVNPLCYNNIRTRERITYRLMGNAYVQLKPFDGFSIKSTYAPSFTYYRLGQYDGTDYSLNENTSASKTTQQNFGFTWTNILNYRHSFEDIHNVDLMAMAEFSRSNTETEKMEYTSVREGTLWYNLQSGNPVADGCSTSYSEGSMASYAFRANYSFLGKYMFTGTLRGDGSSKFDKDNRWGVFPSMALAWRISEEDFAKTDWLSNAKLRLSYGVTGNNAGVSNYATEVNVGDPSFTNIGNSMEKALAPSGIVDKKISWERSKEINIGLDFGFINNRVSGVLDVYKKNSEDLLYKVTLPLPTGGVSMTTNVGEVKNTGIELALTGVIIESKDWHWEVSASFAKNKNEVIEINGLGEDLPSSSSLTGGFFIGKTINNVYGYIWDGIVSDKTITVPDAQIAKDKGFTPGSKVRSCDYYYNVYGWTEGMPIIRDVNGDGSFNSADKKVYNSDPKWTGSLSTTVSWKNFDFSASLYTKQGYTVESKTYENYINPGDRGWQKLSVDYYIPAGTLIDCDGVNSDGSYINPKFQQTTHYGKYPFFVNKDNGGVGSIWAGDKGKATSGTDLVNGITDASYVKVKNITLGYSLPKNALNAIHMQKARVYCTVTNPFCWSDYIGWDAEWANASVANDGPATMTVEFGLNLKF